MALKPAIRQSTRILRNSTQPGTTEQKILSRNNRPLEEGVKKRETKKSTTNNIKSKVPSKNANVQDKNYLSRNQIPSTSNNIYNNLTDNCVEQETIENTMNNDFKSKKQPCTPIILTKKLINPKDTIKKIKEWIKNTVHFRSVKDGISIITYSTSDYDSIISHLKEIDFEYYTFTHFANRQKKLVLKGISNTYELNEILEDLKLQSENVVSVSNIFRHIKNKETNEVRRTPSNKYLIYLNSSSDINAIIKNIVYVS